MSWVIPVAGVVLFLVMVGCLVWGAYELWKSFSDLSDGGWKGPGR